jgi:signal transduction histidine kinase
VAERTAELRQANEELRREIAQRQRAEAGHLQALNRLVELQETERAGIARELHDQLGQELNALHLALGMLREHLQNPDRAEAELRRLREQTSHLIQAMHHMAWELRPPALDDFGLEVALQRYCSDYAQRTGLNVRFHARNMDVERLPLRAETALYRVAQEALANVYFHARATTVSVLLQRRGSLVSLIVEDDGQGFNVEALRAQSDIRHYLGLLGMEERMLLVGGSLTIESRPGEGTTVLARLPFTTSPTPPPEGPLVLAETHA